MRIFVLLAIATAFACAYDPLFLDELKEIVENEKDKRTLDNLAKNDMIIRSEEKEKLDEILHEQPESIQERYESKVESMKTAHQEKLNELVEKAANQEVKQDLQQIEEVNNNLDISEKEAKMKKKELEEDAIKSQIKQLREDLSAI
ncbi:unnamed protein product [Cylicocyclus nassatus]|uniref:Uncharacterized protein n=1 Tax=Cylicocyclus nassatus TaxID=53992 RepID=A0AA36HE92_CYLNA|nr:unnamed protein product [Cylicocyclus nassatus]